MAVGSNYTPPGGNIGGGYGQPPVGPSRIETPQERREALAAEDAKKAAEEQARLRTGGEANGPTRTQTVLVRKKVLRNRGEAQNANGANGSGQTGRAGRGAGMPATQQSAGAFYMLQARQMGHSVMAQAHHKFQSQQPQNPQQQLSNLGVRNRMLTGLNSYINNDYNHMKVNPDDKAFAYRTAEARQLGATISQMVASSTRQAGGNAPKTNEDTQPRSLSPAAYGRQKKLLRSLAAMSEPHPRLPDNLPTDYRPFESVA